MRNSSMISGVLLSFVIGVSSVHGQAKPSNVQTNLEWTGSGGRNVGSPFPTDTTKPNALIVGAEGVHTLKTFALPLSMEFDLTLKAQQLRGSAGLQIYFIPGGGAFRNPTVGDVGVSVDVFPNEMAVVSVFGERGGDAVYTGKPKLGKPYKVSLKVRPGKIRVGFENTKAEQKIQKSLPSPCYVLIQCAGQASWEIANFKIQLSE